MKHARRRVDRTRAIDEMRSKAESAEHGGRRVLP